MQFAPPHARCASPLSSVLASRWTHRFTRRNWCSFSCLLSLLMTGVLTPFPSFQISPKKATDCPRCNRELYIFSTASELIMRCRGWDLAGTPCTLIRASQGSAVNPGWSRSNGHTGGGGSATASGGPRAGPDARTLPGQGSGEPNPPLCNYWTAHSPSCSVCVNTSSIINISRSSRRRSTQSRGRCSRSPARTESPLRASRAWIREWDRTGV